MLYNKYGIEILELEDIISLIDKGIASSSRKTKDLSKKLLKKKDFKLQSQLDFENGYLAALTMVKREASRKDWKLGIDFNFSETTKGKIFKCIDENVIPDLDEENLEVISFLKSQANEIFEY